nr:ECF transporter S component [uncultured Agathobaculum sp.]
MTKVSKITYTAIFAAIATILMYFEFPIPFMPPFLKVDLSGAVVLIGAFIFGIAPAITMIGIKDLIHLTQSQTAGSGELADFLMLSTLVIVAVLLYRMHKTRKMAVLGCLCGSAAMAGMGMLTNYYLIIPFYVNGMGWKLDAIFEMCRVVNPAIDGMTTYLLIGILPFNLIKGIILTLITMVAYKKLSVFIKSKQIAVHGHQKAN